MLALLTRRFAPVDAPIEALMRFSSGLSFENPLRATLARHRRQAMDGVLHHYQPLLARLAEGVVAREPAAVARHDELVAAALDEMRASRPRGAAAPLGVLEAALYRDGEEILDDADAPRSTRMHILDVLDRFNEHLGSYARWTELLEELAAGGPSAGPLRVVELAAGHGSFSLYLARHLGARARVTATDLRDEYLSLGRPRAEALGVDVAFETQDATNLSRFADGSVDVFVCTQSLHHFGPGMLTRMMGEAARVARRGLCFIDAERGLLPLLLAGTGMLAYGRSWAVFHDTVTSLRRMYYEEELALLAALAPGLPADLRIESGRRRPGFAFVRMVRESGVAGASR